MLEGKSYNIDDIPFGTCIIRVLQITLLKRIFLTFASHGNTNCILRLLTTLLSGVGAGVASSCVVQLMGEESSN